MNINWIEQKDISVEKKVHKYEYGMTDVFGILKLQVHLFNQLILIIDVDGVMFENQIQINGMALHGIRENQMKWNEMNEWNKLMMMKLMLIHHLHEEIRKTVLFSWVRLTIQLNSWKQSEKWLYYLILGWRNQHQHQHHIIKVCEG